MSFRTRVQSRDGIDLLTDGVTWVVAAMVLSGIFRAVGPLPIVHETEANTVQGLPLVKMALAIAWKGFFWFMIANGIALGLAGAAKLARAENPPA
jgi:hypothetical protein